MPRRAIDLLAGLKLKERMTTKRRRRSVVVAIPGKERKSGIDSSAKKKISEYSKPALGVLGLNNGYTNDIKKTFAKLRSAARLSMVDGR